MSEDPKPLPGAGDPLPQVPAMSIDPQKMTEVMNVALAVIMVMQMMKGGQVQLPGNVFPQQPPSQPQPEPQPQPTPPPAPPAQQSGNLITMLLGLLGLGLSGFGQITGTMPVVGPEATAVGPSVAFGSILSMLFGGLGAASPTLGLLGRVFGGAVAAARQTQPK